MNRRIGCEEFQDWLDALGEGEAAPATTDRLRAHAESCPACAGALRVHELLRLPDPEKLARSVPQDLVDSVWPDLEAALGRAPGSGRTLAPGRAWRSPRTARLGRRTPGWLVPAMAAAMVVLVLAAGFLATERARLQAHEAQLSRRVEAQDRRLRALEMRGAQSAAPLRIARLERRAPWTGNGTLTLAELEDRLERIPAATTLLGRSDLESILPALGLDEEGPWRSSLEGIDPSDGIQAGELLRTLQRLGLDPGMEIPVRPLLELAGSGHLQGRS